MNKMDRPYISGSLPGRSLPLGRYLPPLPPGMVSAWLEDTHFSPANFLLDPFGSTPALALEGARCGRRVLVVCNNSILSFMLETLASAPQPADFQTALAELGATRRGSERLEVHLQSLYTTDCPNCKQSIQAQAFLWRRGERQPYARLVDCPHCGLEGEHPVTEADLENLARLGSDSLHRARAMERIALTQESDRSIAEEALDFYLPRPLYILFTLINRVEGLPTSADRKRLLTALLLSLLDSGSSLWPWPSGRTRPRQLTFPAEFKETNLWLALEKSIAEWCQPGIRVPVTHWPKLPPETGGVCLFSGRLRSLLPLPAEVRLTGAVSVLPRPNAAFWTLSALWTGWLWGREASTPLKSAFERRRYDWNWYAAALHNTFSPLNQHTSPGFQIMGLLPELAPGFLAAALTAAQSAGLELESLSLRGESEPGQIWWKTNRSTITHAPAGPETLIRQGIEDFLQESGEPQGYLPLFAAGLVHFARNSAGSIHPSTGHEINPIQPVMAKVFADRAFLSHSDGSAHNGESGLWWLAHPQETEMPFSERLEQKLVAILQQRGPLAFETIESDAGRFFPGLHSPPPDLLRATLEACAEPVSGSPGLWRLRMGETSADQARTLQTVEELLRQTGLRLGFSLAGGSPLTWQNPRGLQIYCFYPAAGAALSPILLSSPACPPDQCILIYPSSRSTLLALRLQRDPRLATAARSGWRFLKIEQLSQFAQESQPTLTHWKELLKDEPPDKHPTTQLTMF